MSKTYVHMEDLYVYGSYRNRHKEGIRMINGLEKSPEKHLPEPKRRGLS